MSSILSTTLTRSALSIQGRNRNAIFQQAAFFTKKHARGRELVKFPWIWPSDSKHAPKKPFTPNLKLRFKSLAPFIHATQKIAFKLIQYAAFRDISYMNKIRNEVLPLVLSRVADAINKRDYNQMDELMTPHLAKLYRHAVRNLNIQGYHMRLEVDVQESSTKYDYELFKVGHPEAYDYTIPYAVRNAKYAVWKIFNLSTVFRKAQDGKIARNGKDNGFGANLLSQWVAFEFGFVVNAEVKVTLCKGARVIDSDSGMMQIPIAISSPHYFGLPTMIKAVSAGKEVEAEEPFRWRVNDLFYIADWNNANNMAKANKNKIK